MKNRNKTWKMTDVVMALDINDIIVALGLVLLVVCLIGSYFNTKAYTVELQATKIEEINLNEDIEVIGYGVHGRIYNKQAALVPYVSTYEYTYNGETFELTLKQCIEGENSIRIYIDESNPSNYCLAEDKVSLKELIKIEHK